jgi:hypothetical protein
MNTTAFDIKTANAPQLQDRLTHLQSQMVSLETSAEQLGEIQKEMMAVVAQIRSIQQDRVTKLGSIVADVKVFGFTPQEIFADIAFKAAASTEEKKDRVSITPDDVANQVLVGTYNINGKQVEIKIGDYNREGKIVRQLVPIAREFKTEIMNLGIDGFIEAIKDNEDGKALLLKNHTATVGKTVGQLVFPNVAPIKTYFGDKINIDDLEFKLGAMALRIENHKITNKETNAVAYMEKMEPHNEAQAAMQRKAKKA